MRFRHSLSKRTGFDFYVDSVSGNDANTGRSASQAFQSFTPLLSLITTGTKIGLARGSHFHTQLTLTANNVTVNAYGPGAAPLIDCSDAIAAAKWSKTAGRTNVYEAPITIVPHASNTWISTWEDNVRLVRVADIATCDATTGSYVPSADNVETPTLYVHASDSTNPGTNGKLYEHSARQYGLTSTGTACYFANFECRRNLYNDGSISVGQSTRCVNLVAREGSKHNFYFQDGCMLVGCQALDAYFAGAALSLFVWNQNSPTGLGITFINCTADADTDGAGTYVNAATGFYGHVNVSGGFGAVTFQGCHADHCYYGFGGGNVTSMTFNNCSGENCNSVFYLENNTAITYTFVDCTADVSGNVISYYVRTTQLAGNTITINNCNWKFAGFQPGGSMIYGTVSFSLNIQNTILDLGTDWLSTVAAVDPSVCAVYSRNNHFHRTGAVTVVPYYQTNAGSSVDSDYNSFVDANMQFRVANVGFVSVAAYQAGTGQDANSTIG